jgi:hypothetical protein
MLFGHNTDVKVGNAVYHLQTEDRGIASALIDTTVYCRGRVLHRRTNNYFDLLPLDLAREEALKKRIAEQHRAVMDEIRSGALHLSPPPPSTQEAPTAQKSAPATANAACTPGPTTPPLLAPASPALALALELLNPKTWLAGKRANLHVSVRRKQSGNAVAGAKIVARIEGAAQLQDFTASTNTDGHAQLDFDMPQLSSAEPALIIEATHAGEKAQLKFQLKARPRVPVV